MLLLSYFSIVFKINFTFHCLSEKKHSLTLINDNTGYLLETLCTYFIILTINYMCVIIGLSHAIIKYKHYNFTVENLYI